MKWSLAYDPELSLANGHLVIAVVNKKILMAKGRLLHRYEELAVPNTAVEFLIHLGDRNGTPCFALVLKGGCQPLLPELEEVGLRAQLGVVHDVDFSLASRALQFSHWLDLHRFCGRCGSATFLHARERACVCPVCDAHFYPQISPCVMGIIIRGDRCLLAHNSGFSAEMYSVLAGFIEPGETAEQALIREVEEEVGLHVEDLRYLGSQSWPFPSQLMLGFVAFSAEGDIRVDGEEILHADWFSADALPITPPASTLSGRLIRMFVEGELTPG